MVSGDDAISQISGVDNKWNASSEEEEGMLALVIVKQQ